MINDEQAEKCAEFIRDNAAAYAKAKSERIYLHEFRKSQKAMLINACDDKGVQAKEAFAYSHADYIEVLEGYRIAVEEEEKLRWMMVAAQAKIDIWKTESVNSRNVDRAHR